jgi:uncharacterized cupredoxin-like copper-binding protein
MRRLAFSLLALLALQAVPAAAHEAHKHQGAIDGGKPGIATAKTRTVTIIAKDTAFAPASVSVKSGETVRFVVRNEGKLVHELTIGTKDMQLAHQKEMQAFAESGAIQADRIDRAKLGAHAHGNSIILEPGQSGELVWTFAKAADLEFGCNIPGHYDQGMKGSFRFETAAKSSGHVH